MKTSLLYFLIIIILFLIAGTKAVNDTFFICQDGTQIALQLSCDGIKHCPDGSDELKAICFQNLCPPKSFRCHYGACVSMSARCDGIKQCADGSDENYCGHHKKSCNTNEFKCTTSGECIENSKICNKVRDCKDNSDESYETCEDFVLCPPNTYRCKHGGCVSLNHLCNGRKDCIDGSDESDTICKVVRCNNAKDCAKIRQKITCPPIVNNRAHAVCHLPYYKGKISCNKPMPIGAVVQYECKEYFVPESKMHYNNTNMVCQYDGTWNREVLKCVPDCGQAQSIAAPLIVHGWFPEKGKWPWHSTLFALEEGQWTFSCGGSLISERIVLTAAHCAWDINPEELKVGFGKIYSDYNKVERYAQFRDVKEIIRQPLYQDFIGNYGSDIAFLILNEPVIFSDSVRPVCIDWQLGDITEHLAENKLGLIVGMGVTEKDKFSERLRATYLPVVSEEVCIKQQQKDFRKYVTYTSFCAGFLNGTGVCNGDSGGGLVFPKIDDPNRWVLQGIVSVSPRKLGTSFCDPQYYTVFTKVGMYIEWIKHVMATIHDEVKDFPSNIIL